MPFGLKNASATFVTLMNEVLKGIIGKFCFVYIDDIIVYSKTLEEHMKHLEDVLQRFKKANLTINKEKSEFCKRQVEFLGHIVSKEGTKRNPEKVRAISDFPTPQDKDSLRRFLGSCGWYQSFIKNFSTIAEPLYRNLKKKFQYHWGYEQQDAFETLKRAMCSEVTLSGINYDFPLILKTDASNVGLGAVL